jgi:hypothetical protein
MPQTSTQGVRGVRRLEPRPPSYGIENPEACCGYAVLDAHGQKFGRVEELFVNDFGEPEYLKVKAGFAGFRSLKAGFAGFRSLLLPVEALTIDAERSEVSLE